MKHKSDIRDGKFQFLNFTVIKFSLTLLQFFPALQRLTKK